MDLNRVSSMEVSSLVVSSLHKVCVGATMGIASTFATPKTTQFVRCDILLNFSRSENILACPQIDLRTRSVRTIVGNGVQGHDLEGGKIGREQVISSPWDVILGRSLGKKQLPRGHSLKSFQPD